MSQFFAIHPQNPQARLISQAVAIIRSGGVVAYPTDSCYALGCHIGDKGAMMRIHRIRRMESDHNFSLICRDLSELGTYAKVSNTAFRLMKNLTPGPFTFILKATHEVPRRLQHPKRKTIGLRVPDNNIAQALLEALGEPIISTTLILPDNNPQETPETDAEEIRDKIGKLIDLVIDGGHCGIEPTTVVDLMGDIPEVVRQGKGIVDFE